MAGSRKVEVRLVGDASKLSSAFRKGGKEADSFGKRLRGGAGSGLKMLGLGVAGAAIAVGVGLGAALKGTVGDALQAEESQKRLDAALRNVGATSAGLRGKIDAANASLSNLSGFDDEDLQNAFSDLVRTTGDASGSLKEYGLIADLARAKNIPLASASKVIGRVMTGNTGILKRYGIQLRKGATTQEALAAMQKKFGGAAAAYGKTTQGSIDRARVAFGNIKETIGAALLPAVAAAGNAFAGFAARYIPVVQAKLAQVSAWISAHWPQIKAVLISAWSAYAAYFNGVVRPILSAAIAYASRLVSYIVAHWPQIRATALAVFAAVRAYVMSTFVPLAQAIINRARQVVSFIVAHWPQIRAVIGRVMRALAPIVRAALAVVKGVIQTITAVINGDWSRAWAKVKQTLAATWALIKATIRAAAAGVYTAMAYVGHYAMNGIVSIVKAIPDKVGGFISAAASSARDKAGDLYDAGVTLGSSLLDGIKSMLGSLGTWVADQVRSAVNGLIGRAKSAFTFSLSTGPLGGHFGIPDSITIGPPSIPFLGDGGIVRRPTLAVVGEAGPEAVVPLGRGGFGGDTYIITHVHGTILDADGVLDVIRKRGRFRTQTNGSWIPAGSVRTT